MCDSSVCESTYVAAALCAVFANDPLHDLTRHTFITDVMPPSLTAFAAAFIKHVASRCPLRVMLSSVWSDVRRTARDCQWQVSTGGQHAR